uniref:Uncharacterized protein n=1 Tax=Chromera velia CCMP2878 TaxID=1169474 RepID=A0A0G4IAI9_9ALVE|eukprot:Cvel_12546.t1-p1 / transcript=Cvel_12546.t1 / gene=Cvel_12546 / organism=Chromera_velia_CCMP2878 / gene_product=hypothetical protein / transcript_product=hypothetical protein / location=Cvel_scaffold824:50572-51018(+) / protein_length=149 / sequence_SO=supercontig / SO=protein_coding / is_pseudo=false
MQIEIRRASRSRSSRKVTDSTNWRPKLLHSPSLSHKPPRLSMGRQAATFGVGSVGVEGAGQGGAKEDLEEAEGNQSPRTFLPIRPIPQPGSSLKPSSQGAILLGIQTTSAAGTVGLRPTVPSSALFLRSREMGGGVGLRSRPALPSYGL